MIEKEIIHLLQQSRTISLVTIIDKNGSAPRLPGSKMIVEVDGTLHGTIGGGRMEHEACQAAVEVANGSAPLIREFDMQGSGAADDTDMICGGIQLALIERLEPDMLTMFEASLDCFADGAKGLWVIDITNPDQPLRSFVDLQHGDLPVVDCKEIMRRRVTRLVKNGDKELVIDPLPKCGTVILIGAGHVSREVARLADYVEFEVVVCDDRMEFSNPERFPMARFTHVVCNFKELFKDVSVAEDCYLLIMTRGHSYDQEVLGQALKTPARYIGMIGSKRKRTITYSNLRDQGFGDADFARVHCPVGLAIGSESPKEIAVSIIAEVIAARAGAL